MSAYGFSDSLEQRRRWVLYAGRFVWKRQLTQMRDAAKDRGLIFTHEVNQRLFSVKLTIDVLGEQRLVDEFAEIVGEILAKYAPHDYGGGGC